MVENKIEFFEVNIVYDNIRSFSTSLHLLQKVGKDITFDIEDATLTLRALNDLKSSFVSVEFNESFFERFFISDTYKSFSCKLAVKPICAIFRNIKNVRAIRLTASLTGSEHELAFEMQLSNGITRTHRFRYMDCEIMNALFEEEDCSCLRAKPKVFAQILDHLHQSPEVAVETSATSFTVRSFHKANFGTAAMTLQQQQQEMKRHMTTGLSVSIQEFEAYQFRPTGGQSGSYQNNQDAVIELIFCLREVNAFLGFCEALDLPDFDFFFSQGGRAIKFSCKVDGVTVALVLATIESHASRVAHQTNNTNQQQQVQSQQHRNGLRGDGQQQRDLNRSDATFGDDNEVSMHHMEEYSGREGGATAEDEQEGDDQSVNTRMLPTTVSALVAECERDEQRGTVSTVKSPIPQPMVTKYTSALLQGSVNTTDSGESGTAVSSKPKSMNRRKRLFDESSDED